MKKLILIPMLVACGAQEYDPNAALNVQVAQEQQEQADTTAETPMALVLAAADDMPECEKANLGQLIYVEETQQFFFCAKKGWSEIDVRGKDGKDGVDGSAIAAKDGKDGRDGVDGKNGENGKDGRDGVDGQDGADAQTVDANSWIHPVTNKKWFIGRQISTNYISNMTPNVLSGDAFYCPTGAHSPTNEEYMDGLYAGLWEKFSSRTRLVLGVGTSTIGSLTTFVYGVNSDQIGQMGYYTMRVGLSNTIYDDYAPVSGNIVGYSICVVN